MKIQGLLIKEGIKEATLLIGKDIKHPQFGKKVGEITDAKFVKKGNKPMIQYEAQITDKYFFEKVKEESIARGVSIGMDIQKDTRK
jgi:hypothetical protein